MIHTNRLMIRRLLPEDWPQMKAIAIDFARSEFAQYDHALPTDDPGIIALTKRFADTQLFFSVFLKGAPEMIGYVCFHQEGDIYDLGYCFHSAYHGKGYAFEACSALLEFIRRNHQAKGFTAGTALKNTPSCALLRRLGFTQCAVQTLSFHTDESGHPIQFEGGQFVK